MDAMNLPISTTKKTAKNILILYITTIILMILTASLTYALAMPDDSTTETPFSVLFYIFDAAFKLFSTFFTSVSAAIWLIIAVVNFLVYKNEKGRILAYRIINGIGLLFPFITIFTALKNVFVYSIFLTPLGLLLIIVSFLLFVMCILCLIFGIRNVYGKSIYN